MIRELKTLVTVAQEGTFAAAGERVGLTQAAVSAQMKRLEGELGFELFDRSARAARLNPRGHQVVGQAQELIRLASGLGSRGAGAAAPAAISVGAIASAQRSFLPAALAQVHKASQACHTRVIPGVSIQLLDLVDSGKIDMALIIRPPFALPSELRWTTLAREPFLLLVPRQLRGNDWAELLRSQAFVRYDRASFGGRQVDRFLQAAHLQVREVCELDELEAIVELVAKGVGVALLPQTAGFRRWPAAVRAIGLGDRTFYREVGLVHRPSRHLSEHARSLAEAICTIYERSRSRQAG
ncbi:MAG TPA: LysR family transcriptional regulator [Ramlibacter sp.]|nr:LysR family transcriptional regulator [Ramlibacter sp.]